MLKYTIIVLITIISFFTGFFISNKKSKTIKESLIKDQTEQIAILTQTYQKTLNSYKDEISNLQLNNIVSYKTIYLPSGEKIVTKIVDKSVRKEIVNKKSTYTESKNMSQGRKVSVTQEVGYKRDVSNSLNYYKVGIIGTQSFNTFDMSNLKISSGIRLFSLPIFLTGQAPLTPLFYKHVEIGFEFEF